MLGQAGIGIKNKIPVQAAIPHPGEVSQGTDAWRQAIGSQYLAAIGSFQFRMKNNDASAVVTNEVTDLLRFTDRARKERPTALPVQALCGFSYTKPVSVTFYHRCNIDAATHKPAHGGPVLLNLRIVDKNPCHKPAPHLP
jgi:hypothetical protein